MGLTAKHAAPAFMGQSGEFGMPAIYNRAEAPFWSVFDCLTTTSRILAFDPVIRTSLACSIRNVSPSFAVAANSLTRKNPKNASRNAALNNLSS